MAGGSRRSGNPEACTPWGNWYWDGRPVSSRNNRIALAWFLRGVRGGDPEAMLLRFLLQKGSGGGRRSGRGFPSVPGSLCQGAGKSGFISGGYVPVRIRCGKRYGQSLEHYRLAWSGRTQALPGAPWRPMGKAGNIWKEKESERTGKQQPVSWRRRQNSDTCRP